MVCPYFVLGNLGTHRLQSGTAAALYLSPIAGALHVLLDGSLDDVGQGFCGYWLAVEQLSAAGGRQQAEEER
jgi:hypothetical protein